jgi:hypothetical protein
MPHRPWIMERSASEVLRDVEAVAARARGERIPVGVLLAGVGPRLYGLALMLFALPEAIPFPAMGLTGLIAIPVGVLSVSMLVFGMRGELPGWIARRHVRRSWVLWSTQHGGSLVRRIERFSHPRLVGWSELGRPVGLLCLALSIVMAVPLPFSNVAPGVTVVAIGLAIFQRDGLLLLLAMSVGLLILTGMAVVLTLGWRAVA